MDANTPVSIAQAIAASGIEPFEARVLLSRLSGRSRIDLVAHPERQIDAAQAQAFRAAADRRRSGEPIAYLVGEREFYGLALHVTSDVLIPRPETELLVDFALERLPPGGTLADLGTGSGAIALAVKAQRPDARVTAIERSAAALSVASANAARHMLDIELLSGDWFVPIGSRRFDVIVSNPPYVAESDTHLAEGDVRFEPRLALLGGADGLDPMRAIVAGAGTHLQPGGWIGVEHGQGQEAVVRSLFIECGLESVGSKPDLGGIARVCFGKYNSE